MNAMAHRRLIHDEATSALSHVSPEDYDATTRVGEMADPKRIRAPRHRR